MHRSFKLHQHRHTGKLIHHRHTSYLALVLVMVASGLCMLLTETQARAATLTVSATVPAPIPIGKPIFTAPAANTTVENPDVHFEGICPVIDPAVIIALTDGSDLIGSSQCQPDGTFAVDATLYEGTRSIIANVLTITGGAGESSDPLTITYKRPVPPAVPSPATPSTPPVTRKSPLPQFTPDVQALTIIGQTQFVTYGKQSLAVWKGSFSGGVTPYKVMLDWGDGERQLYSVDNHDLQTYLHAYKDQRNYDLAITLTDKDGRALTRHFAVVSLAPTAKDTSLSGIISPSSNSTAYVLGLLYLTLLLAILWVWRYEFLKHRKVVAVPVHYRWQKQHYAKKKGRNNLGE